MKKFIVCMVLFLALLLPSSVYAKNWVVSATDGTTGGTAGKLDAIDACDADGAGYDLEDKDAAIVYDPTGLRVLFYIWDDDNATAESDPIIIRPDFCNDPTAHSTNGRWVLLSVRADSFLGGPQVLVKSAAYDITVEEATNGVMVYQSANQADTGLPAVADDMIACVFATGADGSAELYVEPGGSDHIDFEGTSAAAGEHLRNSSDEKDDYICVMGQGANTWKVWGYRGTWVEETPP